jgi:aspartate/methionine/tyrosine aminotransferase
MELSHRARTVAPFYAMTFGERAAELAAAGHHVVRLGLGEPDFGAPPAVRAAMRSVMDGRPLGYTPAAGLPELRAAIAGFYADRHGVQVDPGRVVVTAGASAALLVVLAATVEPGSEVLMADPSYPCNRQLVETFGARVRAVPTTPRTRYQLDSGSTEAAWTPLTRAVMVASPANPTGTSIPPAELAQICRIARDRGAWRVVDEIYLNLRDPLPGGGAAPTALALDPDALVVDSFSKYFGMTGWRLGWCVLPHELVGPVERLAMNYLLCASAPVQLAALAALTPESLAVCEQRRRHLVARRAIVLDGLARIGLPVPVPPDGAFYVYLDVSGTGLDSWDFCVRALEEVHVALTPGRDFGQTTAATHVRLSYAASDADLHEGLRRLEQFVSSL